MAYEKQTWTTGEVITQEKLNHMEDGIANAGGGMLVLNLPVSQDPETESINTQITGLPYTATEIIEAAKKGTLVGQIEYENQYGTTVYWPLHVETYNNSAYPSLRFSSYTFNTLGTNISAVRAFVSDMNPNGTFNVVIKSIPILRSAS